MSERTRVPLPVTEMSFPCPRLASNTAAATSSEISVEFSHSSFWSVVDATSFGVELLLDGGAAGLGNR